MSRRLVVALAIAVMFGGVVRGLTSTSPVLAWQMFPEASTWEAEIVRVLPDGSTVPIDEPWPGGYRWREMVTVRGLGAPSGPSHAAYGLDETLDTLQEALDWVAGHTPLDTESAMLRAVVTHRRNDDPPRRVVLESAHRPVDG